MSDSVQLDLSVPDIDWDNYEAGGGGGAKIAPPQVKDTQGNVITYFAQLPDSIAEEAFKAASKSGDLYVTIDPITLVNNGPSCDGFQVRFTDVYSTPFTSRDGKAVNASPLGNFLRAAQVDSFKPRTLEQYKTAVRAAGGRVVPVILEWEVYDKQTKTTIVKGYDNFPGEMGAKVPVVESGGRKLVARAKIRRFVTAAV